MKTIDSLKTSKLKGRLGWIVILLVVLTAHLWLVRQGWESDRLPGNEYRQTHTAITALFVQRDQDFSLAYPTPLLGKPWSIPYEFPLYQWSVVAVSDVTGWPLIQCGRLVTLLSFYAALPALAWLVRRYSGSEQAGWLVILFTLMCPLYIFYARSFLIDIMALMFSVWYARALVTLLDGGSWRWAAVANFAGLGAGLVKIMTLMVFSIPLAAFLAVVIIRNFRGQGWRGVLDPLGRWAATAVVPIACSYAWIHYADSVKAQNPNGVYFLSEVMHSYHFGTWADRLKPDLWFAHARAVLRNVVSLPVVATVVITAVILAVRGRGKMLVALGLFTTGPLIFPILYAWHEYYFITVGFFFLAAMAVGVSEAMQRIKHRWLAGVLILVVVVEQLALYHRELYPDQALMAPADAGMPAWIRASTDPDDILIIGGDDWSPMVPFRSQRRALMIRRNMEGDLELIARSLEGLAGEQLGAFILKGNPEKYKLLSDAVAAKFPFHALEVAKVDDFTIWADEAHRDRMLAAARAYAFPGVELSADATSEFMEMGPSHRMLAELPEDLREALKSQIDYPVSLMSQFPSGPVAEFGGLCVGAHPRMSIWMAPPAGRWTVSLDFGLAPAAHHSGDAEPTDGVGFSLWIERSKGQTKEMLWRRVVDPAKNPGDRGLLHQDVTVEIGANEKLIVVTDPGYADATNRDWALIRQIRVK